MRTDQTEFTAKEADVCRRTGLSRNVVRAARAGLQEGVDWRRVGRDVSYSPEGLQRLEENIMKRDKGESKKTAGRGAVAAEPVIPKDAAAVVEKTAVVVGLPKNRQIVLAEVDGEPVRVQVRSSENFVIGMELACQHVEEDLYTFVGRCPRARGVW